MFGIALTLPQFISCVYLTDLMEKMKLIQIITIVNFN